MVADASPGSGERVVDAGRGGAPGRLADSEEPFRLVFERAPCAMAVLDLASDALGRVRRVNAAFECFTGRGAGELAALTMAQLLHPEEVAAHLGRLTRASLLGEEEPDGVERRYLHAGGSTRWGRGSTVLVTPRGTSRAHLLVLVHDVTEQRAADEALRRAALHDALTGLANRAQFTDRLGLALSALGRQTATGAQPGLALLYLDLDHFKPVNDRHGHSAGDIVLRAVADRLRGAVRAQDTVARLGGDEFAVICPETDPQEVAALVARIDAAVREPVPLGGGVVVDVAASIGAVTAQAPTGVDDLMRTADASMYRAKGRRGR